MIKKESYEKILAAYLVIEFILFCIIKIAEQTAGRGLLSLFMYLPILLNFVVIVYSYHTFNKQTANLNKKSITIWGIPLALLFTLCADVFLVLIHQQNILVFGYYQYDYRMDSLYQKTVSAGFASGSGADVIFWL